MWTGRKMRNRIFTERRRIAPECQRRHDVALGFDSASSEMIGFIGEVGVCANVCSEGRYRTRGCMETVVIIQHNVLIKCYPLVVLSQISISRSQPISLSQT